MRTQLHLHPGVRPTPAPAVLSGLSGPPERPPCRQHPSWQNGSQHRRHEAAQAGTHLPLLVLILLPPPRRLSRPVLPLRCLRLALRLRLAALVHPRHHIIHLAACSVSAGGCGSKGRQRGVKQGRRDAPAGPPLPAPACPSLPSLPSQREAGACASGNCRPRPAHLLPPASSRDRAPLASAAAHAPCSSSTARRAAATTSAGQGREAAACTWVGRGDARRCWLRR